MANGTISTTLAEWLLVALIVFSLVFEFLVHKFEHWINHKHPQLKAVTWVLYRELMLLGLVSFVFIMYETIAKPVGDTVLSFEFAHVFIFLLAIFYTIVLVSAMATSLRMSRRWKRMEQIDLARYLQLKEKYTEFRVRIQSRKQSFWRIVPWWFPNFNTLFEYWNLHELMAFHDIRFQVIYYRNLPEHFRFATFLRRIKASTFLQLVETHWSLWVILLVLVLADITRRSLTREDIISASTKYTLRAAGYDKSHDVELPPYITDNFSPGFIIGGAVVLFLFCHVLSIKIRSVYWELTKHPRVYYKNIEPHPLSEEESTATRQEHNSNTHRGASGDCSQDTGDVTDDLEEARSHIQSDVHSSGSAHAIRKPLEHNGSVDYYTDCTSQAPSRKSIQINRPGRSDLSTHAISDTASRVSMDETTVARNTADGVNAHQNSDHCAPFQNHGTPRYHSLDLARPNPVINRPMAVVTGMQHTSVAQAAVSTASLRTMEHIPVPQRTSLEIPRGPCSNREPDRDDRSGRRFLKNPRMQSCLSPQSKPRHSIDIESSRVSVDFSNSLGSSNRRSLERARVTPSVEVDEMRQDGEMDNSGDGKCSRQGETLHDEQRQCKILYTLTSDNMKKGYEDDDDHEATTDFRKQNSFLRKQKTLAKVNATIMENHELQEAAHNTTPSQYPRFVTKLFPRLGRVASPVEKLFWFGSHRFYMYCVEFTLFFSTVLVAAAFASLSLLLLRKREITAANIVSFVLPPLTLSFVLLRIAGIVKKYIFVIHNASLVPETVVTKAIHTAKEKGSVVASFDDTEASGDETEFEDNEFARERRRTLGRYIRSEAEAGNITGVDGDEASRMNEMRSAAERRARKRTLLLKLRSRRADKFAENTTMLPV